MFNTTVDGTDPRVKHIEPDSTNEMGRMWICEDLTAELRFDHFKGMNVFELESWHVATVVFDELEELQFWVIYNAKNVAVSVKNSLEEIRSAISMYNFAGRMHYLPTD
jgi:hypothetical protein